MTAEINIYNPSELGAPLGQYMHVTRVRASEYLFIAGMLAADASGAVIGAGDFAAQAAQVFKNVHAALESAGASWSNIVQFTTYLVHSPGYPAVHGLSAEAFPDHVSGRQVSAEHASHGRPPRRRTGF